jgi:isopentenyldiphosphate isomerase
MTDHTEQYEVLDENCHKTGQILDRATVHKQELWHEVVNVWVMNSKGELLMQLRSPDVELAPETWDVTVGTHLHPGEEPVAAAERALKNAFQIELAPEDLKHIFNIQSANPMPSGKSHKVFGHVFMVQRDLDPETLPFDPKDIEKLAWVPLGTLMAEIGSTETQGKYFPRANNYYSQLFTAFQAWM